jgi:hypothetical protein
MFISNQEKDKIFHRLASLELTVENLLNDLNALQNAKHFKEKSTLGWTEEARARQSARLKKSWEERKITVERLM